MSKKKPYFHNNVEAIRDAPDAFFIPLPYDELMDWKIGGWEIPSSVACMIRETTKTGKVKEYIYSRSSDAKKRARKIMDAGNEFIVCTHEAVHHMSPELEDYDDPLA